MGWLQSLVTKRVESEVAKRQHEIEQAAILAAETKKVAINVELEPLIRRNETLRRELDGLHESLQCRRQDLSYEQDRLNTEIAKVRTGLPDSIHRSGYEAGFSKGFDFAMKLLDDKFKEHLNAEVKKAVTKENIRFERILYPNDSKPN